MIEQTLFIAGLVVVILISVMLANRLRIAYPILLVLAGLALCFVPGMPAIQIDPELILIIFLPPLLYEDAFGVSWKELWRLRRIISSFAFPVVFVTALVVALVANAILPGFSIALGFVLGGIVSPTDTVSTSSIVKFVRVPRDITTVLNNESLFNDASSLIIFRFALIAVGTGQFILWQATLGFLWMVVGGVCLGIAMGYVVMRIHRFLPTDNKIDTLLTIITPYVIYILAEAAQSSGVLAVVSAGIFLSPRRYDFLSTSSRVMAINVWESLVFLINGFAFLIIGLGMPQIMAGLRNESIELGQAIGYGLLFSALLIAVRIGACGVAWLMTRFMSRFIKVADARPDPRGNLLLGWAGMRGAVSLAAALSIPLLMADGQPFPHRDLILFITFVVILVTLILQGLTMPALIRWLKLPEQSSREMPTHEAHAIMQGALREAALEYLREQPETTDDLKSSDEYVQALADRWQRIMPYSERHRELIFGILERQRRRILQENRTHQNLDEAIVRHYLMRIDMEEERLRLPY